MEYVNGMSIDVIYQQYDPLSETKVSKYTKQLCFALEWIHDKGIIQRDIKGKNILIDKNDNVKLAHFGSAIIDKTRLLMTDSDSKDSKDSNENKDASEVVMHGSSGKR